MAARVFAAVAQQPGSDHATSPTDHIGEDERVATREDYPSLKRMLPYLRNKGDPNPAIVAPFQESNLIAGRTLDCVTNTARYLDAHPEAVAVKCFRVWISPQGSSMEGLAVSAQFHIMPYHDGKYVEVTPPEMGDEGKNFMIVPTSRAYSAYTAWQIVDMHHTQRLRLLLGGVFWPASWLEFQQALRTRVRAQADAARLEVYCRPFVYDLPTYVPRELYLQLAEEKDARNRCLFNLRMLLELIDAKRWTIQDKLAGSPKEQVQS